jgi:sulfur carrier protein ThiS
MRINVHIYSSLRHYLPPGEKTAPDKEWEMPDGSTVRQILERLGLPRQIRVTVLVNNSSVDAEAILREGDIIHILPQMAGG